MNRESSLNRLAITQNGLIAVWQLEQLGYSLSTIRKRVERGALIAVCRSVVATAPPDNSYPTNVWREYLRKGPEAILLGAAGLHLLGALDERTASRSSIRVATSVASRELNSIPPRYRLTPKQDLSMPTCKTEALLLQHFAVAGEAAEQAAEKCIYSGLTTHKALSRFLDECGRQGLRGCKAMRTFLNNSQPVKKSELERRFAAFVRRYGIRAPELQVTIHLPSGKRYRVDALWREYGIAVELDGRTFHSDSAQFQKDRSRQNELVMLGLTVLRYTWRDIRLEPERVAAELGAIVGHE